MRVMKFGGGCLRDADDFLRVAQILQNEDEKTAAVLVVSAIHGVTDRLERATRDALLSEESIRESITHIQTQHMSVLTDAVEDDFSRQSAAGELKAIIDRTERLLYGVAYTGELSDWTRVLILSQGERLCAVIMSAVLNAQGIPARALESDKIGMTTDAVCDNATAVLPLVRENLQRTVVPLLQQGIMPVITGFFGCTESGKTSSFGRNGSDYSAAVIAYALGSDTVDIWKDVDGFMTADPRIVSHAKAIDSLSYYEAAELSYFGAKILHPRTVEPLLGTHVKIRVRNVNAPERIGTVIQPDTNIVPNVVKSVTYNKNIAIIRVHGAGVGHRPGVIGEIGRRLSEKNINIYSVLTSQTCINLLLDIADMEKSWTALRPLVGGVIERIEPRDDMALVAVVGEGLLNTKGLAARAFSAVAAHGLNVEMFSAGASDVAYYFIVRHTDLELAVRAVHECFFSIP